MTTHVVVHQFDPSTNVPGGIEGYIGDVIRYAPSDVEMAVIGSQDPLAEGKLGRWRLIDVGSKRVPFFPVVRLERLHQHRRVPHSARLIAGLTRFRPDLDDVVLHCHRAEIAAAVSVLYPGRPLFVFIHSDGADAFRFRAETFWRFAPGVYFALERFAVKRARRSVVMSQAAVSRLQNHGSSVVLGHNWFDPSTFYGSGVQALESNPEIGWAGRLEPPKDPRTAVQVFAHLRQKGVSFRGWMAGSGTLADDVRRDIDQAGLTDTVQMLGPLSPNELGDRLRQSSVFLMTSLWEGIPRVAIEALACGVPVVAPDVGEMHSLVSNGVNGFVSSNGDALDLAELVVGALSLDVGDEIADTVSDLDARRSVDELFAEIARHTAPGSPRSAAAGLGACK